MAKTGHVSRQSESRVCVLNHFTKLPGETCVMHLLIVADFSKFPKALRCPGRHKLLMLNWSQTPAAKRDLPSLVSEVMPRLVYRLGAY